MNTQELAKAFTDMCAKGELDAAGKKYSGANKYVVHIKKGQLPPAKAFWSLTMYNADYFFVDNPLNRYTLS